MNVSWRNIRETYRHSCIVDNKCHFLLQFSVLKHSRARWSVFYFLFHTRWKFSFLLSLPNSEHKFILEISVRVGGILQTREFVSLQRWFIRRKAQRFFFPLSRRIILFRFLLPATRVIISTRVDVHWRSPRGKRDTYTCMYHKP